MTLNSTRSFRAVSTAASQTRRAVGDLELLPRLHAQHARQMMGVVAGDFRAPVANLIDEEPPACHVQ